MSQPYIGEIRAFGFNFAPQNWAFCNGQPMNISDNPTLFNVIGTTYGGNGTTTFNMPNLQGQVPMHWGTGPGGNTVIGQVQGTTQVTLTQGQTPSHNHVLSSAFLPAGGTVERTQSPRPSVSYLSDSTPSGVWSNTSPSFNSQLAGNVLSQVGGSQPHDNMQPYLAVNFCICLFGVYPSQT
jgi:microcystin-dependent protein